MRTLYKDELRENIMFRKAELETLNRERAFIESDEENPFKDENLESIDEVIRECEAELFQLEKDVKNPAY